MKVILQIGVVFGVCLIGEAAACFLPFPFPASVLSMILLFLLLCLKVLKIDHIRQKADFLLQNMAFFFIPGSGHFRQFNLSGHIGSFADLL
ncbi:MAG: CidA/LrgA family protein [[Clostridium] leptum]